jgi:hypothetical protein
VQFIDELYKYKFQSHISVSYKYKYSWLAHMPALK